MTKAVALLAGVAFAMAAPAAAAPGQAATAQQGDWSQRIETTAEGGYRMGNPDAAVKLVEYASITCSHCADFNAAATPLRDRYVRSGQVSWEVRPFLIFPSDPGIFLLLQCQGPSRFFELSDQLYATQPAWTQRLTQNAERLQQVKFPDGIGAFVRASGVDQLFRASGMSEERIAACLTDRAGIERLVAQHERYARSGIDGTPTFLINGQQANAGSWNELEPLLRAAAAN